MDNVSDDRRRMMSKVRSKDTGPEMTVRKLLHAAGYRYRLHRQDLPGRPDLVFPSRRTVIQVHGCFWHQHPGCRRAHIPKSRQEYWVPKLARNVARDRDNERRLEEMGWRTLVIWECELAEIEVVAQRSKEVLGPPGKREQVGPLPGPEPHP